MDPRESVEKELSDISERARKLVDSTEPRLFTVRPDLSSWSASECIAHLNISTSTSASGTTSTRAVEVLRRRVASVA